MRIYRLNQMIYDKNGDPMETIMIDGEEFELVYTDNCPDFVVPTAL